MEYVCKNIGLLPIWEELTKYCKKYESVMSIKKDEIGYYRLETLSKKPFIATCVQKKHVGLYSVVMYRHPEVIPKELENFRVGKSCMGFVDFDENFDPITQLLDNIFEYYASNEKL